MSLSFLVTFLRYFDKPLGYGFQGSVDPCTKTKHHAGVCVQLPLSRSSLYIFSASSLTPMTTFLMCFVVFDIDAACITLMWTDLLRMNET